ncbi:hypothetical protein [Pseudooceanicola sp. HF7]|uniref:hypothetical protein n=1 Tax=Pseudooceanicola sp. HF7 TaxID=2721560 RepID=UPI001430E242|nr:hypothetical protein [Pseudooceanicola sp. HF7]NIZ09270.1 hypothetical protein [Pseudooceanicola sp. HF7]
MRRRSSPVLLPILGLFLAWASVVSAGMMAPDRSSMDRAVYEMTHGPLTAEDLCGTEGHGTHSCPFCHALPDAPSLRAPDLAGVLRPHDGWRCGADLYRAAQARKSAHSPRAPPRHA